MDVSGKLTGFEGGCVATVESDFTSIISICGLSFDGELFDETSTAVLVGTGETTLEENENPVEELTELTPKPPKIGALFSCLSKLVGNVDSVGFSLKLKLLTASVGLVLDSTDDNSEVNFGSESVFDVEVLKLVWAPKIFDEGKLVVVEGKLVVALGWELNMFGEVKLGAGWALNILDKLKLAVVVVCWPNIVVVGGEPNIFEDFVVFDGI